MRINEFRQALLERLDDNPNGTWTTSAEWRWERFQDLFLKACSLLTHVNFSLEINV